MKWGFLEVVVYYFHKNHYSYLYSESLLQVLYCDFLTNMAKLYVYMDACINYYKVFNCHVKKISLFSIQARK